jgi:hypothetical protein
MPPQQPNVGRMLPAPLGARYCVAAARGTPTGRVNAPDAAALPERGNQRQA